MTRSLLDSYIHQERQRLFALTGDQAYLDEPLYFERVILGGGIAGQRWKPQRIPVGEHLKCLRAMLGLCDIPGAKR